MRKILAFALATAFAFPAFAQKKKFNLADRAADHLMLQISSDHWLGTPDSIDAKMDGLSRGLNAYVMLDKPFKGDQRFSVGFGVGVSTSHIFFDKMSVDIAGVDPILRFNNLEGQNYFKKYKIATTYVEIPVEFRFSANPEKPNKTIKAALGMKVGTMLNAHTKGKTLKDAAGTTIVAYTQKQSTRSYFNTTRIAATARVGYGNFSLFTAISFSPVFKDGVAEDIKNLQIGLTLSGL